MSNNLEIDRLRDALDETTAIASYYATAAAVARNNLREKLIADDAPRPWIICVTGIPVCALGKRTLAEARAIARERSFGMSGRRHLFSPETSELIEIADRKGGGGK